MARHPLTRISTATGWWSRGRVKTSLPHGSALVWIRRLSLAVIKRDRGRAGGSDDRQFCDCSWTGLGPPRAGFSLPHHMPLWTAPCPPCYS